MLSFTGSLKVYVAVGNCDMRKSFEGLAAMVETEMKEEVRSGALFVFGNRRRTRLKILYFDGTGLRVLSKKLEAGTFSWPKVAQENGNVNLRPEVLAMLTDGVELKGARLRPWYERQ
ncbi:MAG: transposase [Verrucomicrobia bacterium 61-8]|nr:MAG: transposase [Verrucomicrobia bacterium 61-8]